VKYILRQKLFAKDDYKEYLAKQNGWTKQDVELFAEKFLLMIKDVTAAGERVHLDGFGDFYTKVRKAGIGQNPKTGEKFNYPEEVRVKFVVSKKFKDVVNGR
jgi:nucleoid DNA-binding protein